MKARNFIGGAIFSIGFFVTIGLMDGSAHEIALRFAGIAMIVAGALIIPDKEEAAR